MHCVFSGERRKEFYAPWLTIVWNVFLMENNSLNDDKCNFTSLELAQIMAPIDPLQLLKALASLLSEEGGIRGIEEVSRLSSLMKKFSKKLVSRCVYCNVLRATKPEILTAFLDEDGWSTLNGWISDAKDNDNSAFLVELLKLCQVLPMTVDRLKQNNTAKLVKSLTKHENAEVKSLASNVVISWMKLIKGETNDSLSNKSDKLLKKKRKKDVREKKEKEDQSDDSKNEKDSKEREYPKIEKIRIKDLLERKNARDISKKLPDSDDLEDVKPMTFEENHVKKPKLDRPKTVKTYHAKFRSTGLEEATPLPKNVLKKNATVDKSAAVAAAKNAVKRLSTAPPPVIPEKKLKPSNLMSLVDTQNNTGPGIKLIPPKPRPVHILQEDGGFMDALVSAPSQPARKKKKGQASKPSTPTTPPSPTHAPPKFQFYKDTLELNESDSKDEKDKKVENKGEEGDETMDVNMAELVKDDDAAAVAAPTLDDKDVMDGVENELKNDADGDASKNGNDATDSSQLTGDAVDFGDTEESSQGKDAKPKKLQSILSHGRRKDKKKSVRWVDDSSLKQIYYFELDETERVNVSHSNFVDMKSLEMKRERQAFETARRLMGDKMEEQIPWTGLVPIDLPPPLVELGCNSTEREVQKARQELTLQEIYFSREMVPDTPGEPDLEPITSQEPKNIPLEDDNNPGATMDYSQMELPAPKPSLPPVLSTLMMSLAGKVAATPEQHQPVLETKEAPLQYPPMHPSHEMSNSMNMPLNNQVGPPLMGPGGPGHGPSGPVAGYDMEPLQPPPHNDMDMMGNPDWPPRKMEGIQATPEAFFRAPIVNMPPSFSPPHRSHPGRMQGNMRGHNSDMGPPRGRMMNQGGGRQMNQGGSRGRGPPRVPCRHFMAGGCRYGVQCNFLHPGVNGPLL